MKRSQSKYFSTAARMNKAFLALLEQKDFSYITVKEICETAGVNRSTFYLHYETIADLLAESAQHLIDEFVACMPYKTEDFLKKLQSCPLDELYLITPEYLAPYLRYIREHRRIFKAAIAQAPALRMEEAYRDLNRYVFAPILTRYQVRPEDQNYMLQFFLHGLMALIDLWLQNDCRDSIDHIMSLMQRCVGRR